MDRTRVCPVQCMTSKNQHMEVDAFAHARIALEFDEVLELIASRCVNDDARETVRATEPETEPARIEEALGEVEDAKAYHIQHGNLPIADTHAAEWITRVVDHRDVIPPEGLLSIAEIERAAADLLRRLRGEPDRFDALHRIAGRFVPQSSLVDAIDRAIEGEGNVRDNATPRLAGLRKGTHRAREGLRAYSEKLSRSFGSSDYATFTGSRYVLLLPREKCKGVDGIVHATSHSGGSLYFEPLGLVKRNNELETAVLDERAETARILAELTERVRDVADLLLGNIGTWEALDVLNAKGSFCNEFRCNRPAIDSSTVDLVDARHPLLEFSLRTTGRVDSLVPLNLRMEKDRVLVITGANAGGKTVTLKTLGLFVLMTQSGVPVPCAEGSALPVFHRVFADIGDEQSIASSLSTFTSHLRHLDMRCREADARSLCLVDEIGDGTDPEEGAALAIATLEGLLESRSTVVATTHYGRIKTFALSTDGVANASMAFDDVNNCPLYRLLQGTAGRSRGLETARRLGFSPPVIERAEGLLGEDSFRLENILSELEASRIALERERNALRDQSEALNHLIDSYSEKERTIREYTKSEAARARDEAEALLRGARKEIEHIVKELRESQAARPKVRDAHATIQKKLDELGPVPETPKRAIVVMPGDVVSISPTGEPKGIVISAKKDMATVDINGKRIKMKMSNLYRVTAEGPALSESAGFVVDAPAMESTTLDVRGCDREEALDAVDRFLDRAVLCGVGEVKVIHGFGDGVLVRAIEQHFETDSRVKSRRLGSLGEGGGGVSFIELK